jgi:hypothetical protein
MSWLSSTCPVLTLSRRLIFSGCTAISSESSFSYSSVGHEQRPSRHARNSASNCSCCSGLLETSIVSPSGLDLTTRFTKPPIMVSSKDYSRQDSEGRNARWWLPAAQANADCGIRCLRLMSWTSPSVPPGADKVDQRPANSRTVDQPVHRLLAVESWVKPRSVISLPV